MSRTQGLNVVACVVTAIVAAGMAGCGSSTAPPPAVTDTATPVADGTALSAREQELARRESEVALQERENELSKREAELTAKEKKASRSVAVAKSAPPRPVGSVEPGKPPVVMAPVLTRINVPAGTQITVSLASALSSKTANTGDPFEARLTQDILADGKVAVPAGTRVTGTITDVVSGSNKIGGTPSLGLRFDGLELANGKSVAINGELMEQAKSDTGRDTAKIVGGGALGAIVGHQIKGNNAGKIIGGLLGGAIGAVAAQKTGTELELAAGTPLTIALESAFEVTR